MNPPAFTPPGIYSISLNVSTERPPIVHEVYELTVQVPEERNLTFRPSVQEVTVGSGSSTRLEVTFRNGGNIRETSTIALSTEGEIAVSVKPGEVELDLKPGEEKELSVEVRARGGSSGSGSLVLTILQGTEARDTFRIPLRVTAARDENPLTGEPVLFSAILVAVISGVAIIAAARYRRKRK
jgi:uncharacterized membrane protein